MGEVRYIWPDLSSPKAQIQFSSLVRAMADRKMAAVVRWVLRDGAEPSVGLCVPEMRQVEDDCQLDFMYWVKVGVPFTSV
jgi:ATP-dependent DNA helicase 2 subunit 2